MRNLFERDASACRAAERFEPLVRGPDGLLVERIISWGQTTPDDMWYDQEHDEWVAVLEGCARLLFDGGREVTLSRGESLLIPRHARHRVVHTSCPCIWLAVHAQALEPHAG